MSDPAHSAPVPRRSVLAGGLGVGASAAVSSWAIPAAAAPKDSKGRPVQLTQKSSTRYVIVVGTAENVVTRQAATELSVVLQQVTGATFPIEVTDVRPARAARVIAVGRQNAVAPTLEGGTDYAALSDDGFAFRSDGKDILVAGAHPRGTLYGAYFLLDRLVGVRWFADDTTVIPRIPSLVLSLDELNKTHVPRFRYRQVLAWDANDWACRQHNQLNGPQGYGNNPDLPGIEDWSSYWPPAIWPRALGNGEYDWSGNEEFQTYVTTPSLRQGNQVKFMDPATRDEATANVIEVIKKRAAAGMDPSSAFHQTDGWWQPDADSAAFAASHGGTLAAPMIDMVNEVARRVKAEVPGGRLETQSYLWSWTPPTGMTVEDNVVITYAPLYADRAHSVLSPENARFRDDLNTWCSLSDDVVLWHYVVNYSSYLTPYANWRAMCQGIKDAAAKPSIKGYFGQAANASPGAETPQLRAWLIGRLTWDPSLDVDDLISEFVAGYYGPGAGPHVDAYLRVLEERVAAVPYVLGSQFGSQALLDFATVKAADEHLAAADAATPAGSLHAKHLLQLRLGLDWVILVRSGELEKAAADAGVAWTADRTRRLERLRSAVAAAGIRKTSEPGGSIERLLTEASLPRRAPVPPASVAGKPDGSWIDCRSYGFTVFPNPEPTAVADPNASDLAAFRIPGTGAGWVTQLQLDALPTDGSRWQVHVVVRADTGSANPGATALYTGIGIPNTDDSVTLQIPVSQLSDGAYHDIAIPGTYSHDPAVVVWVSPPGDAAVPYVYVDRWYFVKVG